MRRVPLDDGDDNDSDDGPVGPIFTKDQKMEKYRAVFDSLDGDHSGFLTSDELLQAVIALGKDPSELEEIFGVSADKDQELSFQDFVNLMEHIETKLANEIALEYEDEEDSDDGHMMIPLNEEEADLYRSVFNMLDTKKKGKLSADDLHTYIRNMSLREASMTAEELNFYFALVEAAEDGPLDLEGFAIVASDHPEFFRIYAQQHRHDMAMLRNPSRSKFFNRAASSDSISGILTRVNSSDLALYRRVFDEFDENKTGRVGAEEVTNMMNKLGRVPSAEENAFLFELIQMAGDSGFSFPEFVALMSEDSGTIGSLGKSISTWGFKQSEQDKRRSLKLIKANISRIGLKAAVAKEDARLLKQESMKLQKIGDRDGSNLPRDKARPGPSYSPPVPTLLSPTSSSPIYSSRGFADMNSNYGITFSPRLKQGDIPFSTLVTPMELLRYRTVFNMLDAEQKGYVTCEQMMGTVRTVTGRQPSAIEVREFMDVADTDGNGHMDFDDFVLVMQRTKRSLGKGGSPRNEVIAASEEKKREKYRQVFNNFDGDRDGMISIKELKMKLKSLGKTVDENNIRSLFDTYDTSGTGFLDFENFVHLMDNLVSRELNL